MEGGSISSDEVVRAGHEARNAGQMRKRDGMIIGFLLIDVGF